jgi:hypothetical protein
VGVDRRVYDRIEGPRGTGRGPLLQPSLPATTALVVVAVHENHTRTKGRGHPAAQQLGQNQERRRRTIIIRPDHRRTRRQLAGGATARGRRRRRGPRASGPYPARRRTRISLSPRAGIEGQRRRVWIYWMEKEKPSSSSRDRGRLAGSRPLGIARFARDRGRGPGGFYALCMWAARAGGRAALHAPRRELRRRRRQIDRPVGRPARPRALVSVAARRGRTAAPRCSPGQGEGPHMAVPHAEPTWGRRERRAASRRIFFTFFHINFAKIYGPQKYMKNQI